MSTKSSESQRSTRRSRRTPRKSVGPTSTQVSSLQSADLSADSGTNNKSTQPIRILRRGEQEDIFNTIATPESGTKSPQTPSRPRSMYEAPTDRSRRSNGNTSEASQEKKKHAKGQGRQSSASASSKGLANGAPVSAPRPESLTPNRAIETPSKAYAGPSFHASPAASSLPMPKSFSKSVPNVDKASSLQTMLEGDTSGMTSASEESESPDIKWSDWDSKANEHTPLDIFFRAEREAKGRTESAPNISNALGGSPSRPPGPLRNQSPTSSVGGIFALEMDGVSSEASSSYHNRVSNFTSCHEPSSVPTSSRTEVENDDERKAKALALKKLLHSPKIQSPYNGPHAQRPPSSKLRKEMSIPNSPDCSTGPEFPATPTSFRTYNDKTPVNGYISHNIRYDSPATTYTTPTKPQRDFSKSYERHTVDTKSMENDLRRILKMDVLGSNGVTGI